jgi:hypothetical protein
MNALRMFAFVIAVLVTAFLLRVLAYGWTEQRQPAHEAAIAAASRQSESDESGSGTSGSAQPGAGQPGSDQSGAD